MGILEKTIKKYISTYSLHQILTYLNIQYLLKTWRPEWKLQVLGHLLRNIANIISVAVNTVVLYKKRKNIPKPNEYILLALANTTQIRMKEEKLKNLQDKENKIVKYNAT